MSTVISKLLSEWSRNYNDRQKLQHVYLSVAAALLLTAGVIGLISYDTGQKLLIIAIVSIFIFIANSVAWALLHTFVIARLGDTEDAQPEVVKKPARTRKTK